MNDWNIDQERNRSQREHLKQEYVDPNKTEEIEREKEEQGQRERPKEQEHPKQSSR